MHGPAPSRGALDGRGGGDLSKAGSPHKRNGRRRPTREAAGTRGRTTTHPNPSGGSASPRLRRLGAGALILRSTPKAGEAGRSRRDHPTGHARGAVSRERPRISPARGGRGPTTGHTEKHDGHTENGRSFFYQEVLSVCSPFCSVCSVVVRSVVRVRCPLPLLPDAGMRDG